jgi:PAS domain S-box-containing protein
LEKAHDELERRVEERTADLRRANQNLQKQIRERERIEKALRDSERKFRTLSETVPAAVLIIQGTQFKYVNPGMERMTGFSREELYRRSFWEGVHPKDRDIVRMRGLARLRGEDVPPRYELRFVRKNGDVLWVDVLVSMLEYEGSPASLVTAFDITERKRNEEDLREAHRKLVNAREEERRSLAAELHDSIAQDLIVLQLMVQAAGATPQDPESRENRLREAGGMCSRMIREIRSICHGLYPPMLETLGLYRSLNSLAEFYRMASRQVQIHWSCCSQDTRFHRDIEIALFRIAQESISNAIRHGDAHHVDVTVTSVNERVAMEVVDDGSGFDLRDEGRGGLGMQSMRERVSVVNGRFVIDSGPKGTRVRAEIPVGSPTPGDGL